MNASGKTLTLFELLNAGIWPEPNEPIVVVFPDNSEVNIERVERTATGFELYVQTSSYEQDFYEVAEKVDQILSENLTKTAMIDRLTELSKMWSSND